MLLTGVICVILGNSAGVAQQSSGGPPQETIAACQGKNEGEPSEFQGRNGTMTGTYRVKGKQSACVAQGHGVQTPDAPKNRQQFKPYTRELRLPIG